MTKLPQNKVTTYKHTIGKINNDFDWQQLANITQWVIDEAIVIQQIPAPTFQETARANHVADKFRGLGLQAVEIDEENNVYGLFKGKESGLGLMLSAHTDTVFPEDSDLSINYDGDNIYGPGLGDNSIGVSGMMGVLFALNQAQIIPACDLWFVATSCEEGLGDLRGIKAAYKRLKDRIKFIINFEGLSLGYIYNAGIASKRLHITTHADGGHSWAHFGRTSAIHELMKLGAKISSIRATQAPRTTYNIGMVDGGRSINSIATEASMWLDMRSEERETLAALEKQVLEYVAELESDDLRFTIEVVGDRPAGSIPAEHPLVQMSLAALEESGHSGSLHNGSTDGNVPLSDGCPTVTIGITNGGNAHRLDEYINTEPISIGMRQAIILTLAAAQWDG
jgi:tripeptide aminopeptidase